MGLVVFHIGYPKTGTTTLQNCLLRNPQVHCLGETSREGRGGANDPCTLPSQQLINAVVGADTTRFAAALPALRGTLETLLADGRPVLVSDEALTMAEYMRTPTRPRTPALSDHVEIAGRLRQLWPEARVLVSIREQKSFLVSFYLQRLRGDLKFVSFDGYIEAHMANIGRRSILNVLRYDEMYAAYAEAFGGGQVRLMVFESYRDQFGRLIRLVADALGLSGDEAVAAWDGRHENKRGGGYAHARWIHRILSEGRFRLPDAVFHRLHHIFTLVPDRVEIDPAMAKRLDDFFAPSNRTLEAMTGLELSPLGYAVGAAGA